MDDIDFDRIPRGVQCIDTCRQFNMNFTVPMKDVLFGANLGFLPR